MVAPSIRASVRVDRCFIVYCLVFELVYEEAYLCGPLPTRLECAELDLEESTAGYCARTCAVASFNYGSGLRLRKA